MAITIVGLGPGDPKLLTREAWDLLSSVGAVWLRTAHHPTVAGLPAQLAVHSFDYLYEAAEDFAEVYHTIAGEVLRLSRRPEGVVYAVPGHPLVGESTVQRIIAAADGEGLSTRIVEGLSFVEPTLTLLKVDALDGLQIHDAIELASCHFPPLNPDRAALVGQVYSRALASDLKLVLMSQYPDEHPVALVHGAGTREASMRYLPLFELDRHDVAHLTSLYISPMPATSSFEGLQETVAHLRAPDGCPWDREQTHESLASGLLEETYEVIEAIDRRDMAALQEELGDLLLQIVLQTEISVEEGDFLMTGVIAGIDAKLKHRHPHVWGETVVEGADDVKVRWEDLKREEKTERDSLLDGVPSALPALHQAAVYGERVARGGFDWESAAGAATQVREEWAEVKAAGSDEEVAAELGDLLFAVANWARHLGVEPEAALRLANARFARRFRAVEEMVKASGRELASLTSEEWIGFWRETEAE